MNKHTCCNNNAQSAWLLHVIAAMFTDRFGGGGAGAVIFGESLGLCWDPAACGKKAVIVFIIKREKRRKNILSRMSQLWLAPGYTVSNSRT